MTTINFAQDTIPESFQPKLNLQLSLLDFGHWNDAAQTSANLGYEFSTKNPQVSDYLTSIYLNPSMDQAVAWNQNAELAIAYGSQKLANILVKPTNSWKKIWNIAIGQVTSSAGGIGIMPFPFGKIWLHEEFHRAVMSTNQVASKNPYDDFIIDLENGSVSQIFDSELARFKANDPKAFTRMVIAGGESELLAIRGFQEQNFFFDANLPVELKTLIGVNGYNSYFNASYANIDSLNIITMRGDGADISHRDFTGHDYSGWLWHLFRPDAAYSELGVHPSGVGIDRYVTSDKLTEQERAYFDKVKSKAWINWLSPMLYGFRKIQIKEDVYVNFSMSFQPTPFGTSTGLLLYYKNRSNKFSIGFNQYANYEHRYYGTELNWIDKGISPSSNIRFDSKISFGSQPQNLDFMTDEGEFFLMGSIKSYIRINSYMDAYVQVLGKTAGWIPGNEYLDENFRARFGCRFLVGQ